MGMEKNPGLILFVLVGVVLAAILGAAWLSSGKGKAATGLSPTARFTAKPGTTRKNAVMLSSSKRAKMEATAPAGSAAGAPLPVRSLTPEEERIGSPPSPVTEAVTAALNAWNAELGLEKLTALLEQDLTEEERAEVLAAMGVLNGQKSPPDHEGAERCFSQALQQDLSPALRARIVAQSVQSLMAQGRIDDAHARVKAARDQYPPGEAGLQLDLLYASLEEQRGNRDGAEEIYAAALEKALTSVETLDRQTDDLLRMAALRLTRIYKDSDRGAEASTLTRRFQAAIPAAP
jgi:tetratricopeptide (TPR) repeat protein